MKKTITIHLANFIFNIEEVAYKRLQVYLTKISAQFSVKEERDEIMHDIESRIAELFREQISTQKEVIIEEDVLAMINIMGNPEEYIVDEGEEAFSEEKKQSSEDSTMKSKKKQIYRDNENAILGGVCSGLAAYLGVDPVVIRAIFIIVTIMGGSGILIYLILYFAIPEAKTIADKLKMKGEKVDISSIKDQFQKVKNELNNEENKNKIKTIFNRFIGVLVSLFTNLAKVLSTFLGVLLLVAGIAGFVTLIIFFNKDFLSLLSDQSISVSEFLGLLFESNSHKVLAYYSLIAVLFIPVSTFFIKGIRLLFKVKNKFTSIKVAFTTIWVVSICILLIVGVYLARNFEDSSENVSTNKQLDIDYKKPLFIEMENSNVFPESLKNNDVIVLNEMINLTDSLTHFAFPRLVVEPSKTDSFEMKIIRRARGRKELEAISNANSIIYNNRLVGNHLLLSDYFSIPSNLQYRGQNIKVVLKVPQGRVIEFGNEVEELTCAVRGDHNLKNTIWINRDGRMINITEKNQ